MKRLVRLLLVNWYRVESASIEIQGHAAFIGPNASGKSSLLDAIQTVLVGGNKHELSLNASAGEKSTRNLRDYCLGVVRDPDNPDITTDLRPREQALTYLVLCFEETATGRETSVGLSLHARLDQAQEQIDGRFIAPGVGLTLPDLMEQTPQGMAPIPWKRLRESLYGRCPELKVVSQAGEFVSQLCAELSDGRRHLDPVRFLKSFRNAITFAPIRNVSDFVRQFVLEDRPIQVRQLQQALRHYRDIRTRTEDARRRESALESIRQHYGRADQAESRACSFRWVEQEARFNALEAVTDPLARRVDTLHEGMEQARRQLAALDEARQRLESEWIEASARLAASDVAQQKARIKSDQDRYRERRDGVRKILDDARRGLARVHRLLDDPRAEGVLSAEHRTLLCRLGDALPSDDALLTALWPEDPAVIVERARALCAPLTDARDRLKASLDDQAAEELALRRTLEGLRERIRHLEAGESDLSPGTRRLMALLAGHGIEAVPLCDRVDVADEHWRDAVERFLGGQREALLVAPERVVEAIRIYRREGGREGIHGSRIINTLKTRQWLDRAEADSLAAVVTSGDEHARAYVNRLMGNVVRVEQEEALTRHERAITPDGMLATNGAVLRTQPVEPMLGREARVRSLAALRQRFDEQAETYGGIQQARAQGDAFKELLLDPFLRHLENLPDLAGQVAQRRTCDERLEALEREALSLNTGDYEALQAEVNRLGEAKAREEEAIRGLQADLQRQDREVALVERDLQEKFREQMAVSEQRRSIAAKPGLDAADAQQRLEELEARHEGEDEAARWQAIAEQAEKRAGRALVDARRHREEAWEALRDYLTRWPVETPPVGGVDDHVPLARWAGDTLDQVRETQLARYHEQAAHALREAEHAFRADFMSRLKENLTRLDEQLAELRRNLRSRPFHGQYYSFIKKPAPEFDAILRWVESWTPEQADNVGGLFDTIHDPSHPHREAIQRVQTLLMEAGEQAGLDERLADYRHYYSFDVKMTDADGRNPEMLSRRLGKGSGGEHQSPFYVAIGAALAAAYRLHRDEQDGALRGGMALAVFDEAFSKLDVQNAVSALGFLDELGLQVILAAPDEKYGLMSEHMDTIVNVYRSGGTVHIDADYLKPAARVLLSSDNPLRPSAVPTVEARE
ncbi:hypothetical protein CKO35_02325 [Ectothiorhodospira shaposhnikovii]|uniref:SbcC/MukB-like Walker B domain-containing protein n=1 Tax=Ectothiorhodospira shaposhnikovii TaxID=1054 RepID=UPI001903A249|nr:SbcC/MukB-like Walker B domain-containing protein [Ectothiorhodospira shaposhnikovii]MBK1672153.1 hypothetical protein [Ectothiorhodospira shaposhnikovii]